MKPFYFFKPDATAEVLSKKNERSQFLAGGTNLVDLLKKHIAEPDELIDLTKALSSKIERSSSRITFGALAKNSAIATDKNVLSEVPLIAKAILAGASPQIRNMASAGGNILQRTRCPYFYETSLPCNKRNPGSGCSAIGGINRMHAIVGYSEHCIAVHPSDFAVALAALDASVHVTSNGNKQSIIPFKDFHRLPGDRPHVDNNLPAHSVITSISVPTGKFAEHSAYVKVRDRDSYAFALVSVAAALEIQAGTIREARLASGGVAHKPWRWTEAENFLKGKKANAQNFKAAAALAAKSTQPLAGNEFKAPMLRGAIEVALTNCLSS